MAALVGYDVDVTWAAGEVEGLDTLSFSGGRDVIEVTSFPDTTSAANAFKQKLMGLLDFTMSASGQYENVTNQIAIRDAFLAGTSAAVIITWTSGNTYTITMFCESFDISNGIDGAVETSFGLTGNSALVIV